MAKIAVTGASGKAGRAAVHDLIGHSYEVVPIDLVPSPDREVRVLQTDLTDYGQAIDALDGVEAVVHLANIPADRLRPAVATFNANVAMKAEGRLARRPYHPPQPESGRGVEHVEPSASTSVGGISTARSRPMPSTTTAGDRIAPSSHGEVSPGEASPAHTRHPVCQRDHTRW